MRLTFRRVAFIVIGLYFLVTCYTGYMVIRKKFEKPENDDLPEKKVKGETISLVLFHFIMGSLYCSVSLKDRQFSTTIGVSGVGGG